MLLIPGIALTTSLRDMINGDTISGLLGLSEAVLKAGHCHRLCSRADADGG